MIDARLRPLTGRVLTPLATRMVRCSPLVVTVMAALVGLAAAMTVALGLHWVALGCWIASRILDGLDGAIARRAGTTSDLGGYLDMTLDTVVYAAIPLGIAYAESTTGTWALCAVLIATFYVNIVSWSYLAALLEKRGRGAKATGEQTSITMPGGLVEGAETIAAYVVLLAFPSVAPWGFAVMAVGVGITVLQRLHWAKRNLA